MSLTNEERVILVELETEKARNIIQEIPILEQAKLWNTICNRLYYAAFHAVTALLIKHGFAVNTHQGAAILLHKHFVQTGILTVEEGKFYSQLQRLREESDYNCTYYATQADTTARIEPTCQFVDKILQLANS